MKKKSNRRAPAPIPFPERESTITETASSERLVEAPPTVAPMAARQTDLWRYWPLIAAIAVAAALAAWLLAAMQPKRYEAVAIGAVAPVTTQLSPSDVMRGVDTLERRVVVSSIAALAGAPVTLRAANAGAGYQIRATVLPNTNLFRIEVDGPDARRTAQVANQVPSLLGTQARAMYRLYDVTLVSPATPAGEAVLPRIGRAVATGLAAGIALGFVAAWLLARRRYR